MCVIIDINEEEKPWKLMTNNENDRNEKKRRKRRKKNINGVITKWRKRKI